MPESQSNTAITPMTRLNEMLATPGIKTRFQEMLKDRAPAFISSIISAVRGSKQLSECEPMSIISAAAQAATLDLSITLGHAYIVPYKGLATFQMGWAGYVQLFLRTGQAKSINALVIHEGDIKRRDRLSGEIELTDDEHFTNPVIGYLSHFTLKNGYFHALFMAAEEVEAHAKRYSQAYQYDLREGKKGSKWSTDRDAMALKTVTKLNLKKYAPLSIEMQQAIESDDAIEVEGQPVYPDAPKEALPPAPVVAQTVSSRLQAAVGAPQQLPPEDAGETPELPI